MLFNFVLGIYCFHCKKYHNPYTEVYLNIICEGSVSCSKGHVLGYVWDRQWIEFFNWGKEN
jgi:hypothetical protein